MCGNAVETGIFTTDLRDLQLSLIAEIELPKTRLSSAIPDKGTWLAGNKVLVAVVQGWVKLYISII